MSTFYNTFCYFLLHIIIIAESSLNNITNDDIEKQHISELLTQQEMYARNNLYDGHRQTKRAVTSIVTYLWDNATIPYIFAEDITEMDRNIIMHSTEYWTTETCVRFIPRTTQKFYIKFVRTKYGCFSNVGVQVDKPMPQIVYVSNYCLANPGGIIHELGHTLGFWHEHMRPDRKNYVEILWENIAKEDRPAFYIIPKNEIQSFGSLYDLGSIMHLPLKSLSKNGDPTIRVLANYTGFVGQRVAPSQQDIQQLKYLYGCEIYIPPGSGDNEYDVDYIDDTLQSEIFLTPTITIKEPSVDNIIPVMYSKYSMTSPTESHVRSTDMTVKTQSFIQSRTAHAIKTLSTSILETPSPIATYKTISTSPVIKTELLTRLPDISTTSCKTVTTDSLENPFTTNVTFSALITKTEILETSLPQETSHYSVEYSLEPLSSHSTTSSHFTNTVTSTVTSGNFSSAVINPTAVVEVPTLSTKEISENGDNIIISPTPIVKKGLKSGQPVGLKTQYSPKTDRGYWITCTTIRCSMKLCAGDNFDTKRYEKCTSSILTFHKLNMSKDPWIYVGDLVTLRSYSNENIVITCGTYGICKINSECLSTTGRVLKCCKRHILRLLVPGKGKGEHISDGDLIQLRHAEVSLTSWIGCQPLGQAKCKRRTCNNECIVESFILYLLAL